MTVCIQSVAMFGAELWWKGDHVAGTTGRADELQLLVNQEARATTDPDNRSGSSLDGAWPQGSDDAAGEQAAAVRTTAAKPATGRPGTGDCGGADRVRPATHECPCLCRTNGEDGAVGGT